MPANAAVSAPVSPSLTLKRRLNAAPEKVFAAWTEPSQITKWFGPDSGAVDSANMDVRPGGRYAIVFHTEDGEEHHVSGVYKEVVRPEKVSFTWAWRSTPERESFVTVLIKPEGSGCILTLIHERFYDDAARDRHQYGWTGSLDKLERLFA